MPHARRCSSNFTSLGLACLAPLACPGPALAQSDPFGIVELTPGALEPLSPNEAASLIVYEMLARDVARKLGVSQYGVRSRSGMSQLADQLAFSGFGAGNAGAGNAGAGGGGMADPRAALDLREKVRCQNPATGIVSFPFRSVDSGELWSRLDEADPNGLPLSASQLRTAAQATYAQSQTINQDMADGGVPVDLIAGIGVPMGRDFGVNILDPSDLLATYSVFFAVAADVREQANSPDRAERSCAAAGALGNVSDEARYVGTETVGERTAAIVEVPGAGTSETLEDGTEVAIEKVSLAIDLARAVPLRTRFEGSVKQGRETRPITIEKRETDYREVPGSNLYESYRQVLSIGGWNELGPEAAEAQQQMAELEAQLASVPASQRAMMERMLGGQLDTIRQMASGGAIEIEIIVDEIVVNPGVPGGPANAVLVLGAACPDGEPLEDCLAAE